MEPWTKFHTSPTKFTSVFFLISKGARSSFQKHQGDAIFVEVLAAKFCSLFDTELIFILFLCPLSRCKSICIHLGFPWKNPTLPPRTSPSSAPIRTWPIQFAAWSDACIKIERIQNKAKMGFDSLSTNTTSLKLFFASERHRLANQDEIMPKIAQLVLHNN